MSRTETSTALWLSFAIVVVHNVEEHLTMGRFLAVHRDRLPPLMGAMTGDRFTASLIIATLLFFLATWAAARSRLMGRWLVLAIALQIGLALNACQHAAVAVWAGSYAPGCVTGLGLCLPYAVYLVRRAVREEWVPVKPLVLTALAVAVLTAPLVAGMHALAALIS
jgi:hypothetical protein